MLLRTVMRARARAVGRGRTKKNEAMRKISLQKHKEILPKEKIFTAAAAV